MNRLTDREIGMPSTIERYQKDLERLVRQGGKLTLSMQRLYGNEAATSTDLSEEELKTLPDFHSQYQAWYSEKSCPHFADFT